jgi:hypothetical protein
MEFKDYYKILGVAKTATADEIKKAFRKLARKYHPDVSKEPDAQARMAELNEAQAVLSDPEKRDRLRRAGQPASRPARLPSAAQLGRRLRVLRRRRWCRPGRGLQRLLRAALWPRPSRRRRRRQSPSPRAAAGARHRPPRQDRAGPARCVPGCRAQHQPARRKARRVRPCGDRGPHAQRQDPQGCDRRPADPPGRPGGPRPRGRPGWRPVPRSVFQARRPLPRAGPRRHGQPAAGALGSGAGRADRGAHAHAAGCRSPCPPAGRKAASCA